MTTLHCLPPPVAAALLLLCTQPAAHADTVAARCDIHPRGSVTAAKVVARSFSQRQGFVGIDRADGVRQLQYKLHAGEASWQLKLDRVVEY